MSSHGQDDNEIGEEDDKQIRGQVIVENRFRPADVSAEVWEELVGMPKDTTLCWIQGLDTMTRALARHGRDDFLL